MTAHNYGRGIRSIILQPGEEVKKLIFNGVEYPEYGISNFGNVYSYLIWGGRRGKRKGRVISQTITRQLRPCVKGTGYLAANVKLGGSDKQKFTNPLIHRLVMMAFKPISEFPPNKIKECWNDTDPVIKEWIESTAIVHHKDGNKKNNHIDNLEWTNPEGNSHAYQDMKKKEEKKEDEIDTSLDYFYVGPLEKFFGSRRRKKVGKKLAA